MGLNPPPQYKLNWYQNNFIGNSQVKKWHVEDLIVLMIQLKIVLTMTNCAIFVQCATWYKTALQIATSLDKIKELMKAWLPLRPNVVMYNTCLPNQSREEVKYGGAVMLIQHICINLRCILVDRKKSKFGLRYDVVMKLCKDISDKYHHVYCDKLFTSVQLLRNMLACKTHCNGTIWMTKKYLPEGICKPGKMILTAYISHQDGSSNLVMTVWQENRILRLVSTNPNPKMLFTQTGDWIIMWLK